MSNEKIKELKLKYQQALDDIKTADDLKSLLDTAIKFNKYHFDNIVLIHNQNPNAEFLATINVWNNNVGRYVNRGAKGLAVLELDNPKLTYRYLFELKNTNGNYSSYKKVLNYKWEVKEEDKGLLLKNINKTLKTDYESLEAYLYNRIAQEMNDRYDIYFENLEITEDERIQVSDMALSCIEYMVLKKCNLEVDLPKDLDFNSIKNIKVFSKMGSLATDISRDILREVFIQVKKLEKEKERKGELQNGREINRGNEQSNSRGQDNDRNNTDRLGDRVLRGRENGDMVSNVGVGGDESGVQPTTIRSNVERVPDGEQKTRDNNVIDGRGTEQENVRDTGNGRELQGENSKLVIGRTTNATIGQDVREKFSSSTNTPNSRRNDNQGYNRESSIETQTNILDYVKANIGKEIVLNNSSYTINSVNELFKKVNLLPVGETYPIFRDEPLEYIYTLLKESEKVNNEEINQEPNENIGSFFVPKIENLEDEEQDLFEDIDKIGDYNIPDEIEEMEQTISNEEIFENEYVDNEITEDFSLDNTEETQNYIYSEEHNLYDGGVKTKCKKNIEIIKLLKQLEEENRQATKEEQIILAGYNGFGGLANALTPNKVGFEEEYNTFKKILTEEEFASASKSTTTAFYTEQKIIKAMYKALENFGFEQGKILDPSMGTGNFFSVLPPKMQKSNLFGVEIDDITGRIARQLYPNENIEIKGFEETDYPNGFFDVAISNIPFNNLQINDPAYNKYNFKIHDYFIAKMIDKVRAGGIVAIITTKGTLDKADSRLRKYVNERAELIGAIRLPNNAFKQVANTEVTSDIIFFQKREQPLLPIQNNASWLNISENENGIPINNYFTQNPQMILGEMVFDSSMYGNEKLTACKPFENANIEELLNKAIENLHCKYKPYELEEKEGTRNIVNIKNNIRNFSYGIVDDEIYYKENNLLYKEEIKEKDIDRLKGLINVNLALRDIIDFQILEEIYNKYNTEEFNNELKNKIETLNIVYDKFVDKYGYLNSKENVKLFSKDIGLYLLTSIEKENKNTNKLEKTDIFYKPTIRIKSEIKIENAEDSLKVCLNDLGRVDINYMAKLYNKSKDEVIEELVDKIFQDPTLYNKENIYTGYVTADEYLTGYVKEKLLIAKDMSSKLPQFERNVKALEQVQPIPLKPSEIGFSLGSTWIPAEIYKNFIDELLELDGYRSKLIEISYSEYLSEYFIKGKNLNGVKIDTVYGTKRMNALNILENTLNLRPIRINDKVEELDIKTGKMKEKYVLNVKETILAKAKQEEIKNAFNSWLFKDEKTLSYLSNIYNEKFNNYVTRTYDGSNLELPNMSSDIQLRDYQKNVIARVIYSNSNTLIAHEVGAGKSATRS